MKNWLTKIKPDTWLKLAFAQALLAMIGSLLLSDFMTLAPCKLCWYQRIAMYPLVWLLGIGLWLKDKRVTYYALPLALVGLALAAYHTLVYYDNFLNYGIVAESLANCDPSVPCTSRQIEWLGFISIPLLSLIAFSIITACLAYYHQHFAEKK